ncbi:MAG: ankyrin repeat domain-containing protein [Phycisphaerae bacterium]|nr:ankyrin repeat domain-containing protein [Phycisphaerae bacterium]
MIPFNLLQRRNTFACIIALLLMMGAAMAAEPAAPDSEDFRRGRMALRLQNWPLAIEHLTRVQEAFPDHAQTLLGLAAASQNAGKILPAMAWYQAYLRLDLPQEEMLEARNQLDLLDVSVRTLVDKLFAEAVRLAEAAIRPSAIAQALATGDNQDATSNLARSTYGDLQKIAPIQASAGLLTQAEATMRLSEVRHEVPYNRGLYFPGQAQGLEGASWLALAETGSISPLNEAYDKLEGDAKLKAVEIRHLCHMYRYVMRRTPNVCAKIAREFALDPALEHLDIETLGTLRQGDQNPAHLALAGLARHVSLALLRARALALEPWERQSYGLYIPDETLHFLSEWLLCICDSDYVSQINWRAGLGRKSVYAGDLFSSHLPIIAKTFVLFDNNLALTYEIKPKERWWPLLALVWRSSEPVPLALAREFALINYGPLTRDTRWNTPLHTACYGANLAAIRLMLEHDGPVTLAGRDGETMLMAAVGTGVDEPDIIELLIAHEANVNCTNYEGDTPMHLAAGRNCNKIIEALAKHGAKLEATNKEGKTPLQIAKAEGNQDAIETLQRLGASR